MFQNCQDEIRLHPHTGIHATRHGSAETCFSHDPMCVGARIEGDDHLRYGILCRWGQMQERQACLKTVGQWIGSYPGSTSLITIVHLPETGAIGITKKRLLPI